MSLTTVAATISATEPRIDLPPAQPEQFQRSDFIAAAIVALVTLGVYIATLAPNVTLEDSGELITGATKFGVPHPPGYPFWTMTGFVFSHIFPFGNLAWRTNLLSALFGGAANGILTLLVCHSGRWLLQRWADGPSQIILRPLTFYAGMLAGLTIGFSDVMWGQAVITAVHGTVNALFINLVLFFFYLWMIEPSKINRLVYTVVVIALGLTNHHTLIQVVPAIVAAAFFLRRGVFWSVLLAVSIFGLSVLVYISWLSGDDQLQLISDRMAAIIFVVTGLVSLYYVKALRLRAFFTGALIAALFFCYGNYILGPTQFDTLRYGLGGRGSAWLWGNLVHPGWLQLTTWWGLLMLAMATISAGLLFTSTLNRRLIIGVFAAGWVGLMPYAYESFASSTRPPMNWGYAAERTGFFYAVSRQQYPQSLSDLIRSTVGKVVLAVPAQAKVAPSLAGNDYWHRLWLTFFYYGDNLQADFTVPLLVIALALIIYLRRCDWLQVNWLLFLGFAFFFLGFLLFLIEPQTAFDFEHNLQYKVFHLLSHCILAIFVGYGIIAALTYLQQEWPEIPARLGTAGLGVPALCLSFLPFWSNVDHCSQAGHWFGYRFGHDVMAPMERNAVYLGGTDFGRFVPTYMAFVESQQNDRWKHDPGFDRRDVFVITQNALCDTFYCHYIRDQYDPRFRIAPADYTPFEKWLGRDKAYPTSSVTCMSEEELNSCWEEFEKRPDVAARIAKGGPIVRADTSDVFDLNAIVAWRLFQENKAKHTFYLEQSVAIPWTYPYLRPWGLIFKMDAEPMKALPAADIAADYKYWDDYSARLLRDGRFRVDYNATITFGKLAAWHADLYHHWGLQKEEEHWLRIALALCPQLEDSVSNLSRLLARQNRHDEAIAVMHQAQLDDPRNENYGRLLAGLIAGKNLSKEEADTRALLGKSAKSPYDVELNIRLAQILQGEGQETEAEDKLRFIAGLTNWDRTGMAGIVQYYVDGVHDPRAAIAFLEARAKIDPKASEMIYSLAALHASLGDNDDAIKYLTQASAAGGTNALISAKVDPRFAPLMSDSRFQALVKLPAAKASAAVPPGTNSLAPPLVNSSSSVKPPPHRKSPRPPQAARP